LIGPALFLVMLLLHLLKGRGLVRRQLRFNLRGGLFMERLQLLVFLFLAEAGILEDGFPLSSSRREDRPDVLLLAVAEIKLLGQKGQLLFRAVTLFMFVMPGARWRGGIIRAVGRGLGQGHAGDEEENGEER